MRKAFNHIYAAELTTRRQPAGSKTRRAHVIAADDADAKAVVTNLLDEFGVDTLDAGRLWEGGRTQRETPGYGRVARLRNCARMASAKRFGERSSMVGQTGVRAFNGVASGHCRTD